MVNESDDLSTKTWQRALASINKLGYMDGAVDGKEASFQSSFDKGYTLGYSSGFALGLKEALHSVQPSKYPKEVLQDQRKINCQICLNNILVQDSVTNLYNLQKETNNRLLNIDKNTEEG
ncbi:uncharacterized protein LOC113226456 [Hyposmocoma kahamanoa]|uniref:uncharacterized protein LOC113226456 n=1 Tax=Hyposmocoma kahamanoa TaxID=1477025 RepID=UPI000E6D66E3|nr:uncharacterized protein LOC113226456 [Hyposmocoma kahamanoa]